MASRADRAKIFLPFAALSGLEEAIAQAAAGYAPEGEWTREMDDGVAICAWEAYNQIMEEAEEDDM